MLKLLWVIPGVVGAYILLLCVSSLFVDKTREYERDSAFYRFLLNSATACALVICRLKVMVTGAEKLPEGRFLFVCNHRSKFDPIISWYIFRKNHLAFISKPENFNVPVFGRFISVPVWAHSLRCSATSHSVIISSTKQQLGLGSISQRYLKFLPKDFGSQFMKKMMKQAISGQMKLVFPVKES